MTPELARGEARVGSEPLKRAAKEWGASAEVGSAMRRSGDGLRVAEALRRGSDRRSLTSAALGSWSFRFAVRVDGDSAIWHFDFSISSRLSFGRPAVAFGVPACGTSRSVEESRAIPAQKVVDHPHDSTSVD